MKGGMFRRLRIVSCNWIGGSSGQLSARIRLPCAFSAANSCSLAFRWSKSRICIGVADIGVLSRRALKPARIAEPACFAGGPGSDPDDARDAAAVPGARSPVPFGVAVRKGDVRSALVTPPRRAIAKLNAVAAVVVAADEPHRAAAILGDKYRLGGLRGLRQRRNAREGSDRSP